MNITIIGLPGSGKSTLARQLAEQYGLHHVELDSFKHLKDWQPVAKDIMREKVRREIANGGWIVDGNYISTFGSELIDKADVVIWLDYPFPFVFQRLLRRTLRRSVMKEELWNGNRESLYNNLFTRNSVLRHIFHVWKRQRKFYLEIFSDSQNFESKKMIRARNPKDLKRLVRF